MSFLLLYLSYVVLNYCSELYVNSYVVHLTAYRTLIKYGVSCEPKKNM